MERALITGISGQDAYYLAHLLCSQGFEVWGTSRRGHVPGELDFVRPCTPLDLADNASVVRVVESVQPTHVYHLAGQTSVAESWKDPAGTGLITGVGTAHVLEAVRQFAPGAHVFVASSSEIFGHPSISPQNESTAIMPSSPYGVAKAYAFHSTRIYRERHGVFASCGILYNHESPRRQPHFVTRKIVQGAIAISRGEQMQLRLGNLDVVRDWGFAGDFVEAMHRSLLASEADDYVIATGTGHTVRDFCRLVFERLNLNYEDCVVVDPAFWRDSESVALVGDASKAANKLGWTASTSFSQLIDLLIEAELRSHVGNR